MSAKKKTSSKSSEEKRRVTDVKVDSCLLTMRSLRELAEKEAKLVHNALKDMESNLIDPGYILELTKSIHSSGNKNISEYINRNTEILLNEHASIVRQNVIQKMKQQIQDMNSEMSHDAQKLSEDISNFFEFIQINYEEASSSFKRVVELAKKNYGKVEILKEMEDKLFVLQNELHELEQYLLECLMCHAFLTAVTQQESDTDKIVLSKKFLRSFGPTCTDEESENIQREVLEAVLTDKIVIDPVNESINCSDVIKVIERFKESNLFLVQHTQHTKSISSLGTSETSSEQQRIKEELNDWDEKIANAEEELMKAQEKHQALQKQTRNVVNEDVEKTKLQRQTELKKLAEIYKLCTGIDAKTLDIALMKVNINTYIERLAQELDTYPKRKVKEMLKTLDADKKLHERKTEEIQRAQRSSSLFKKATPIKKKKDKEQRRRAK